MCSNSENNTKDIEEFFKTKESNEFYRYYYQEQKGLINTWEQLLEFYYNIFLKQDTSKWLFRGDIAVCDDKRSMREAFKTSLDKAFEEFEVKPQDVTKIEKAIIRSFRRRAHLLTDDKDNAQNQLEALALMRHHGAPTRILDWMYSFFPAVYFAMNREYNKKEKTTIYTVWALNRKWLNDENTLFENDKFLKDKGYFKEHSLKPKDLHYYKTYDNNRFQKFVVTYLIHKNSESLIYAATPYRLNERLAAQRGTLLFSGTVDKTWGENLEDKIRESLKEKRVPKNEGPILWEITFRLSKEERKKFLRGLDEMNINQATLFPDLDGFAESLRTRIAHPESLGI
jgi:hypothetical protein